MKPRAKIELGEIQRECEHRNGNCIIEDGVCAYFDAICKGRPQPRKWDLTDPPRFDERRMELLKALWNVGAVEVKEYGCGSSYVFDGEHNDICRITSDLLGTTKNETLNLAELFGKEDA